jgi:hypothetical protein
MFEIEREHMLLYYGKRAVRVSSYGKQNIRHQLLAPYTRKLFNILDNEVISSRRPSGYC